MESEECKYFSTCSAPLCPIDESSLKKGIWYPGQEICFIKRFWVLDWVKRQKRFAKVAKIGKYFTWEMLKRNCKVKKGIEGRDPNQGEQVNRFIPGILF